LACSSSLRQADELRSAVARVRDVVFLAPDKVANMSGSNLVVDGGLLKTC
jgi:hypothetical protein